MASGGGPRGRPVRRNRPILLGDEEPTALRCFRSGRWAPPPRASGAPEYPRGRPPRTARAASGLELRFRIPAANPLQMGPGNRLGARRQLVGNGVDVRPALAVDGVQGPAAPDESVKPGRAVERRPRRSRSTGELEFGPGRVARRGTGSGASRCSRSARSAPRSKTRSGHHRCSTRSVRADRSAAADASNDLADMGATAPARTRSTAAGNRSGGIPRGIRACRTGNG